MSRSLIERRLTEVTDRLRRARQELAVLDEQLVALSDAADDARIRALVSETPLADKEHHEAQRHADAMARSRVSMQAAITEWERAQDELLDRLVAPEARSMTGPETH
jgi:recombinational DNA repair ATPase RecF